MIMVLTSPGAISNGGAVDASLVHSLKTAAAAGSPVVLISNGAEPTWFGPTFAGSPVQFLTHVGRQRGDIVRMLAKQYQVAAHDVIVLASSAEDMRMGKNGGALLIAGAWSSDAAVRGLGIKVTDGAEFSQVLSLLSSWQGKWWFKGDEPHYGVRALADLSGRYVTQAQEAFASKVTATAKHGGIGLNALLAVTVRSLLSDGADVVDEQCWGVYPSSASGNDDTEVLSDFCHRLRTSLGLARFARREEPLFIRHHASTKRSRAGGSVDREDPTEQVQTLCLNPAYKGKLRGRNLYLIDDCTTHGVSFGVAAAFLRKAGAKSITGVALGKFGNQLKYYEIELASDPFAPVDAFSVTKVAKFHGSGDGITQQDLRQLLP